VGPGYDRKEHEQKRLWCNARKADNRGFFGRVESQAAREDETKEVEME